MSINPNIVLISGDILTLHPNIGLRNLFSVSRDLESFHRSNQFHFAVS